ncbi:hypothetical protein IPZ58_29220 [Streptomyces roseoverticillatus]|nr:hypothetical protein [Streptomyces roseoverticillatus]
MVPSVRRHREAGQALPIYITVVAGLLFLAFAYFAVGQAAASRNGAQSAADAAALAAAQDAREQLRAGLLNALADPASWDGLLKGRGFFTKRACEAAGRFAGRNGSDVLPGDRGCRSLGSGRTGFTVTVRTRESMGSSVIPGTEKEHPEATATAVVVPRACSVQPPAKADAPAGDGRKPDAPDKPGKPEKGQDAPAHVKLRCADGRTWDLDPGAPDGMRNFPTVADLFSVKLSD